MPVEYNFWSTDEVQLNCSDGATVIGRGINRNKQQETGYTDLLVSVTRFKQ
jgi:hypothetical protein